MTDAEWAAGMGLVHTSRPVVQEMCVLSEPCHLGDHYVCCEIFCRCDCGHGAKR